MIAPRGWPAVLVLVGCADLAGITALPGEPPRDAAMDSTTAPPSEGGADAMRPSAEGGPDTTLPSAEAGPDATRPDDGGSSDSLAPHADAEEAGPKDSGVSDGSFGPEGSVFPEGGDAGTLVVIGGTVSGLVAGASLMLQDNGLETLTVSSNDGGVVSFVFSMGVPLGDPYVVTVSSPPTSPGELCEVTGGSGVASATSSSAVTVSCHQALMVSAGFQHTCAILADRGEVACWGDNSYSQLGTTAVAYASSPVGGLGLFGAQAVAAGYYHSCAIVKMMNNEVYCWGQGASGQLGNGGGVQSPAPVAVTLPGDGGTALVASAIAAGAYHTCALSSAGTVYCWGDNVGGDLGNGMTAPSPVPVAVTLSGGVPVAGIAAGGHHSCALLASGEVQCWGANDQGQLGANAGASSSVPVTVAGLSNATAVTAGDEHTCAIVSSGSVECWGGNASGQLGNGSTTASAIPVTVGLPTPASQISASFQHTCATLMDQSVYCWGANLFGQVGNGSTAATEPSPGVPVVGLSFASGASGVSAGGNHSCATVNGGVECWGYDDYGQLGDGIQIAVPTPQAAKGLTGATGVATGEQHTCAALGDGGAACWGYGPSGQLGTGADTASSIPQAVIGLSAPVESIAAGGQTSCAVLTGGLLQCWGYGSDGELGIGSQASASTPVTVTVPHVGAAVTAVSIGQSFVCAAGQGGVDCWGSNADGQCGTGSTGGDDQLSAEPVTMLPSGTASSLTLGAQHACLVLGGAIECWGADEAGQLGNAETAASVPDPIAVMVSGPVQQVSAGAAHTCALTADAGVECWGANGEGQLGNGGTTSSDAPAGAVVLPGATAVASGWYHTCAILENATVECWGWNAYGQLGNGTLTNATSPTPVVGLQGVTALSSGLAHTCAVLSDGGVECWGWDGSGQLGDGFVTVRNSPVVVR